MVNQLLELERGELIMRIIDADSLKETIEYISFETGYDAEKVINAIDEEPTIEIVKHGHWIFDEREWVNAKCSVCGKHTDRSGAENYYDYCPRCGAMMK